MDRTCPNRRASSRTCAKPSAPASPAPARTSTAHGTRRSSTRVVSPTPGLTRVTSPIPYRSIKADVFVTAGLEDNLFLSYTALLDIESKLGRVPHRRVVATIYQHAGHFVDTATPYLPFADTYYDEALGLTQTLGGTSAGESAARADEWPRILRFIGSVRARPGV